MLKIDNDLFKELNIDLYQATWDLTAQIPEGKVSTYGQIARALGDIRAARAVGVMAHANPKPIIVPCHRVVYHNGGLDVYGAAECLKKKIKLLNEEGVKVKDEKIVDFEDKLFIDFSIHGRPPLEKIKAQQHMMKKRVRLYDIKPPDRIKTVGAIDCSYTAAEGFGAVVLLDLETMEVLEKNNARIKIKFPYIPTYLSYRELPLAIKLVKKLNNIPDVLLFDGNGVLHPDGLGLATHAGIILNFPTFGVAKKLLCGKLASSKPGQSSISEVKSGNRCIGFGYRPKTVKKRLVYISPGNLMSFDTALRLTEKLCKTRIPEPIRLAHDLALGMRRESV